LVKKPTSPYHYAAINQPSEYSPKNAKRGKQDYGSQQGLDHRWYGNCLIDGLNVKNWTEQVSGDKRPRTAMTTLSSKFERSRINMDATQPIKAATIRYIMIFIVSSFPDIPA
jgi:hypothetical protein